MIDWLPIIYTKGQIHILTWFQQLYSNWQSQKHCTKDQFWFICYGNVNGIWDTSWGRSGLLDVECGAKFKAPLTNPHLFSSSSDGRPQAGVPAAAPGQPGSETESFRTVPYLQMKPTYYHYWCCWFTATHRNTYILLYDVEGQAPEHDSLALLLLLHPEVGVLVLVITIRVITIFRSVTVMSLSPPLQDQVIMQSTQEDFNLYIRNPLSRWLSGSVIGLIWMQFLICTSGLSLSLWSSYRSLCLSSPQRRS